MATDKNIKVVIQGEDKTGPALASASKGIKGLNTDVSGLAKVLGGGALVAVGALGAFLVSSGKAAAEAEVQIANVTATLSSMGDAALANKNAILKASEAAVKLGFDDESAALSITKFYQRTNDLTKAQELNAVAMDLARAKSLDLETATNLVNQALSGNGRVLAAYGIQIKDTATPLEALGILHDKVAGQAVAFAGTFQGQMEVLDQTVTNLKETIGAALLEAINPLIKEFTEWASKKETQQKIQEIATVLGQLAKEWIPLAVDSFKILVEWGTNLYNIMVKVGDAIIAAATALANFNAKINASTFGQNAAKNGVLGATAQFVNSSINGLLGIGGARAGGGPVSGGSSYLVGENGPEIFSPGTSGFITPNGGGGIVINITGNSLLDDQAGQKIANQIMTALKQNLRI